MTYNPCPKCGAELEMGYGLAGGGMGPYMYCSNERCNFLQKFQDPEMETEGGKPFPLLFDNDWLEQKIRTDPDIECEAGATAGHSEGGDDTVRQAAKEVGYSDDAIDGFYAAMDRVKGVLDGTIPKPGGPLCRFPHCGCNSPWTLCEKDPR